MNHIEKTIDELDTKAIEHTRKANELRLCARQIREIFNIESDETNPGMAALAPSIGRTRPPKSTKRPVKRTTKKTVRLATAKKTEPGRSGSRTPFSKYKGVTKGHTKKDGTVTFMASVWKEGKNQHLGHFDIEEEAAAHAANARGETRLANELFEIAQKKAADQTQSIDDLHDMDKPTSEMRRKPILKQWECTNCGLTFKHQTRPFKCVGCDSASFKEVTE